MIFKNYFRKQLQRECKLPLGVLYTMWEWVGNGKEGKGLRCESMKGTVCYEACGMPSVGERWTLHTPCQIYFFFKKNFWH